MPEGDTIYRTARTLHKALAGKAVSGFETGVAKLASVDDETPVVGRTVERVEARGKWCLIVFSGDLILATHMLMSGSWHLYRIGEKWWLPRSRMRVCLTCGEYQAVAFDVPVAEFHTARSLERSASLGKLGPYILGEGFSQEVGLPAFQEYVQGNPDKEVGVALLDQRALAGLGNVYKSEVAFAAAVNPFRALRTLTPQEQEKLVDAALRMMKANVADGAGEGIVTYRGSRRTTRSMDRGARLWVYQRKGEECRRCGATIQMQKQGTQARSTYWCPGCQPHIR